MELFNSSYLQIALGLLSALILFLFALESLSNEVQELATEDFRKKISKYVRNRLSGTIFGAIATAILQSSTAMTVITVVLVNTGIISFRNSLGLMFGSSIGTTITAQLAIFNTTSLASILLIVGFFLKYANNKKLQMASKPLFFLGFILFSLNILSSTLEPIKNNPLFIQMFSYLSSPIIAYLVSTIFTMAIHSSTMTSSIVVILAQSGVIGIEVAIPMILGANLGTSITALISSRGLNLYARRAGFANFLFKITGTLFFMIFINQFIDILQYLTDDVAQQTAFGHLFFNIVNTIFFLLILDPFEKIVTKLVPGDEEEILFETKYIDNDTTKKLDESIVDIKNEIVYSIENTVKIYRRGLGLFYNPSGVVLMEIQKFETLNDYLDDEITSSIISLSRYKLPKNVAKETVILVKISNTIEQLGDLGEDFSKVFQRMYKLGVKTDEVHIERLTNIHNMLISLFKCIENSMINPKESELQKIKIKEEKIYAVIRDEFDIHVKKLQTDNSYDGNIFVDAISIIELSVSKLRDIRKLLLKKVRECNE